MPVSVIYISATTVLAIALVVGGVVWAFGMAVAVLFLGVGWINVLQFPLPLHLGSD